MTVRFITQLLKFFYPLVKKVLPYQVYAYLAVGAANTLFNIALFSLVYRICKNTEVQYSGIHIAAIAVEAATIVSFILSAFSGFWLNKNFAFSHSHTGKAETKKQFGKYVLIALQGQISAYLLTKGMIVLLDMNASLAYIITAVIMLTINYFLQKLITFRKVRTV